MTTTLNTPVLVVGGGPVGLILALDLGRRGVPCVLIETKDKPAFLPKMERCNARSLEIFRRLGIVNEVRAAGYASHLPMDVWHITNMMEPPLARVPYASVDAARGLAAASNDGTMPREPYQLISQYTLEPLLKGLCEKNPLIDVRFGHELLSFEQDAQGVTARVKTSAGEALTVRAQYMVGCDGGTSVVRKGLGIQLEGQGNIREQVQGLFRCDTLYDVVPIGHGRHYKVSDPFKSQVVCQDSCRHFLIHAENCTEDQMPGIFASIVGTPIEFETLHVGRWRHNLLLAQSYRNARVMLCGDSAHLVIPTGGLGLNTGIGDATDLAWKLAALVHGWGGEGLLQSYEDERRQIGKRNVAASGGATKDRRTRRESHYEPWIREDSERGRAFRAQIAEIAQLEAGQTTVMTGIERGYRYVDSGLLWPEPGEGPDSDNRIYSPSAWTGTRLPHMWLNNGDALLDKLGPWYTVIRFGNAADTSELESAMKDAAMPFKVLQLSSDEPAWRVYGEFNAFLIRPDAHVAWRGHKTPRHARQIAAAARGALDARLEKTA